MEKLNANNSDQDLATHPECEPIIAQTAQQSNGPIVQNSSGERDVGLYDFSSDEEGSYLSENELLSSFLDPPQKSHNSKAFNKVYGLKRQLQAHRQRSGAVNPSDRQTPHDNQLDGASSFAASSSNREPLGMPTKTKIGNNLKKGVKINTKLKSKAGNHGGVSAQHFNGGLNGQNSFNNLKKDLESPFRRYVITTDLRSDLNKPRTAGSKRSFLRGGFPTLMGLGFGPSAGQTMGSLGQNGGNFVSPLDWELYSSTQAHLKNDMGSGTLGTPSFRAGPSLFGGGKTLQLRAGIFGRGNRIKSLHRKRQHNQIGSDKNGATSGTGPNGERQPRSGPSRRLGGGSRPGASLRVSSEGRSGLHVSKINKQAQQRTFACHLESCGKVFNDRASLKKHLTVHGDKLSQFQCPHDGCGKKFLDNAKLKRHMLVHTGEKPYQCELCGKKFSLDFNLKTHLRIHTGEKPFLCNFKGCHKRFNQKSNLHAHMLTHHLTDPNCDANQLLKSGAISINAFGKFTTKYDMLNDGSYSSEQRNNIINQSRKMDELTKLMEKNHGQLFKIEYNRDGGLFGKDDQKSGGYYTDDDYKGPKTNEKEQQHIGIDRPIFKIKFKPRTKCHVHHVVSQKATLVHEEKEKRLSEAHAAAGYPDNNSHTISMYRLGGNFYQQALESLSCCQPPDAHCDAHGNHDSNQKLMSAALDKINETMASSAGAKAERNMEGENTESQEASRRVTPVQMQNELTTGKAL
ncbi:hypothetical protein FGO68_gene5910 [Halteria grandinella]|uniref:C2H2-type domain-containing protein n=1 Tax=Halteria grandinella TaxID=5974 RepID=A0A8J8P172_HALGN|nr:hypothetical protein FGO68_gene5910 [Halteria grandinella]